MATKTESDKCHDHKHHDKRLPVTLLGGFLGAGKTTLLKHILETKHNSDGEFKCAVIVNDMAELNVDKTLIDQSALLQSDEVIAMQNGCVCCTLKSDLVDQITELASRGEFDYMIIEASGVSEVGPMVALFAACDNDHDHESHATKTLNEVSRLDTCVTVVDTSEFFRNIDNVRPGTNNESWPQLMVEQIEYANVVVLNKTDLVTPEQLAKAEEHIHLLNAKSKTVAARNSKVDVMEVVNTKLYDPKDFDLPVDVLIKPEEMPECCKKSIANGGSACCKKTRTFDSGVSQVILSSKGLPSTRHQSRFGITSFLYKARRPFHPARFFEEYVEKYFVLVQRGGDDEDEDEDEDEGEGEDGSGFEGDAKSKTESSAGDESGIAHAADVDVELAQGVQDEKAAQAPQEEEGKAIHEGVTCNASGMSPIVGPRYHKIDVDWDLCEEEWSKLSEEEQGLYEKIERKLTTEDLIVRKQKEALEKRQLRKGVFGDILRSKGFIWLTNTHDVTGCISQAADTATVEPSGNWNVLDEKSWTGREWDKAVARKNWVDPYGDRRQELVFIGQNMDHLAIQKCLDSCLLSDEEFGMGLDGWKATIGVLM